MVRDGRIADAAVAWYAPRPTAPDEWRRHLEMVRSSVDPGWAGALAPALRAAGAAEIRLARAAAGRGVVVTTGQQPGLFGGPLYTWWKALSALALADGLEEATGIPVAPVFWAATDDADFAEAGETFVAVTGGLDRLVLPPPGMAGARLADIPLPDPTPLLRQLAAGAGSAVYPGALDLAVRAYREGTTIGAAYVTLLRAMLEPLGIAVLDAADPVVGRAGAAVLAAALRDGPALEQALLRRERELAAAGFRAQVPVVRGRSLVLSSRDGRRERLPIAGGGRHADDPDATLGPNVLLRPVMERAILPTAAYVAGPGELAYFAQVSAVAETLGLAWPATVPRWSGTIIEPHVQRLLDRHGLDLESLSIPGGAESRVARQSLPPEVRHALDHLRTSAADAVESLSEALAVGQMPNVPPAVLTGARRDLERRTARLERRLVAAAKREQTEAMRDVATLRAALAPAGKPQERVLNLLPILARHGPAMLRSVRVAAADHAAGLVHGPVAGQHSSPGSIESRARERTR
jgi:bacillithiol biosynthesis cysteine-adding enzyme BshC